MHRQRHGSLWQRGPPTSTHRRTFQWRGRFIGRHDIPAKNKVGSTLEGRVAKLRLKVYG